MSTSGQLNTNTLYDSYFWVKWSQASQDIAGNKTKINWSCGVSCGHSFYSNAIKMSAFTINGTKVYGGGTYSNYSKGNHTIASGTLDISHNTDGKKTFSISSFTGWLYSSYNYSCNGGSYDLTTIPRKATITEAADFTDVDNPSISFSNPGGFTLDVWLEPNPVGDHLCVRTKIPNTGKYTWELTDDERNALRSACSGTECTIRVGLYTYIGNTTEADYKDKKFTMMYSDATKPEVNLSYSLDNGSLPSQFSDIYIQGKSKVSVEVKAAGKFGATIQSRWAKVNGKTYNSNKFTSDVIQSSGNVKIVGYATDSREFTGATERTINVSAYSKPLVIPIGGENAILCYRGDINGNRTGNGQDLWIKAKRYWYGLGNKNTCALQYRSKYASDKTYGVWYDLIRNTDTTTDEFIAPIQGIDLDLEKSYTVQIRAIDDIGEYDIKTFDISTRDVALHLGKGGKNVSVGAYCDYAEERTFYSAWKAIFEEDVVIDGQIYIGEDRKTLKDYILSVINGGG